MSVIDTRLIDVGLYSVQEAARLTRVPAISIRRWIAGYHYKKHNHKISRRPHVVRGDLVEVDDAIGLSFLDMMEVRLVYAFRKYGVSLHGIRVAVEKASQLFGDTHPFTMKRFRTDGKRIFTELFEDDRIRLLDLNRDHFVFNEMIQPSLFAGIEFEEEQTARWFPLLGKKTVVIDPKRSFGRPILFREGIPTEILASAAQVEESLELAAQWYDVSPLAVKAAVLFEEQLAA